MLFLIFQVIASLSTSVVIPKSFDKSLTAYAGWYSTGGTWNYRKAITVDHTKVQGTDQTNFPMLVSFIDPSFKTVANGGNIQNASGYDIIFTSADGSTKLDHELEKYVATTGEVVMWVRIPTLKTATDTVVYIYYGNTSISTTQENKTGVWDANTKIVQHMNQNPAAAAPQMIDSTSNANNGTTSGLSASNMVAGKCDGAINFPAGNVSLGNSNNLNTGNYFALDGWYKFDNLSFRSDIYLYNRGAQANGTGFHIIYLDGASTIAYQYANGSGASVLRSDALTWTTGQWYHIAIVHDNVAKTAAFYRDGQSVGTASYANTALNVSSGSAYLGGYQGDNRFRGSLDEFRISSAARNADWIRAEYNNQSQPNEFYSVGIKETTSPSVLSSWAYRKAITIDHTKIAGSSNLANFPVLVNLAADADLAAYAKVSGDDILFAPASVAWNTGTENDKLAHEIETYTTATGSLQAWVKIPNLSYTEDTVIYVYFNNPIASNQQNKTAVWDGNTKMVQHMNQNPGAAAPQMTDSTGNANNGTAGGSMTAANQVAGQIGGATSFDGGDDYIIKSGASVVPTTAATVSLWIKTGSNNYSQYGKQAFSIPKDSTGANGFDLNFGYGSANKIRGVVTTSGTSMAPEFSSASYSDGNWHNYSLTYNGSVSVLYLDGVSVATANGSGTISTNSNEIHIGKFGSSFNFFNGSIDEVQLSGTARSADWIKTEYNNQSAPGTFSTLGVKENVYSIVSSYWSQRKSVTVTNNVASPLTGYQVKLTFDTGALIAAGKMQSTCNDMRFMETDGSNIPYWIESGCNTTATVVWIKTNLASSAAKTIYMYYGNASATAAGNANGVFEFAEMFLGNSLDASKWPVSSGSTTYTIVDNKLKITGAGGNWFSTNTNTGNQLQSSWTPLSSFVLEYTVEISDTVTAMMGEAGMVLAGSAGHTRSAGLLVDAWGSSRAYSASGWVEAGTPAYSAGVSGVGETRDFRLVKNGSTVTIYHKLAADASWVQLATGTENDCSKIAMASSSYTGYSFVDYMAISKIKARQYVATEPSSAFGTEENVAWTNASWAYRSKLTLTNGVATSVSGYQMKLTLDTAALIATGKLQSTCADLRFTETSAANIPYWIESGCNTNATVVWIKTDLAASSAKDIYMYYGNSGATATSGATGVFDFYDGFDGSALDAAKWDTISGGTVTRTVADGVFKQATSSGNSNYGVDTSKATFGLDNIVEYRIKEDAGLYESFLGFATVNSASSPGGNYATLNFLNGYGGTPSLYTSAGNGSNFAGGASGTYYNVKIENATGHQHLYVDDVSKTTLSLALPTASYKVFVSSVSAYNAAYNLYIDWMRVRKYLAADPTSVLGTEEIRDGVPILAHFTVTGTGTQTAGAAQTLTLAAIGSDGNTLSSYTASHDVTFSGAAAIGANVPTCNDVPFGTNTTLTFTSGVATCALKLYKAETAVINAVEGGYNANGYTLSVVVSPSALDNFDSTAPVTVYNSTAFAITLAPRDAYGNTATVSNATAVSATAGTINPASVPATDFGRYTGPDANQYINEKDITVTNNVASNFTGYQVRMILDTAALIGAGKMQGDCDDMRFAETIGTNIPYYLESGCNTSSTVVWIKTELAASTAKTVYFYYGNDSVSSAADGNSVFDFFDDFAGTLAKWTGDTSYFAATGGELTNTPTGTTRRIYASTSLTGKTIESSVKTSDASTDLLFGLGYRIDTSYRAYFCRRDNSSIVRGWGDGSVYYSTTPPQWISGTYGTDSVAVGTTVANSAHKFNGATVSGVSNFNVDINSGITIVSSGVGTPGVQYVDWVRTRKTAATEPTVTVQATGSSIYVSGSYNGNFIITGSAAGNDIITFTNGSVTKTATVYVDAFDHYHLTVPSANQSAGATQTMTITAVGASGNIYPYDATPTLTFGGADNVGSYYPKINGTDFGTGIPVTFTNGTATVSLQLYKTQNASITVTDADETTVDVPLAVTVTSGSGVLALSLPATINAGTPFVASFSMQDTYGNDIAEYDGSHDIVFSGAGSIGGHVPKCNSTDFGTATALTFSGGTAGCTMTLFRAENITIAATQDSYHPYAPIVVSPLALSSFTVDAPAAAAVDSPFTMTVSAKDAYGNPTFDLSGNIAISTDKGTISPDSVSASQMNRYLAPDAGVYDHEKDIRITNSLSSALTDYQVKLTLDTTGVSQTSTCNDIRFATTGNVNIPYWIEGGCGTTSTIVWLKVTLPATSDTTVYLYYGNGSVSSAASGDNVFNFFDDFSGSSIDTNKWNGGTSAASVSSSIMTFSGNTNNIFSNYVAGTSTVAYAMRTKTSITSTYNQVGFSPNPCCDGRATFTTWGSYPYTVLTASQGWGSTNLYSTGYKIFDILYNPNVNTKFVVNGSTVATHSCNGPINLPVSFQIGNSSSISSDWILVRQYASTEPTSLLQAVSSSPYRSGAYAGSFTISGVTTAGNVRVIATNNSISGYDDVFVDAMHHFKIEGANTVVESNVQPAGSAQILTITAVGGAGNTFTPYDGVRSVTLSGADNIGNYYPTCTDNTGAAVRLGTAMDLNFNDGIATCSLTLYKSQQALINITAGSFGADEHTLAVDVTSTASSFSASMPATFTAGVPAQITLTAGDIYGNPATTYVGNRDIIFSGANSVGDYHPTCTDKTGTAIVFGQATSLNFVSGVAHCNMSLYKTETVNVGATDGTFSASSIVGIVGGPFFDFGISLPAEATSGVPFGLGLTARDQYGNNTSDISNTTNLSVNHGNINGATIPASQFFSYTGPDSQTYAWRKNITLTNNVAQNISGYQLKLTLDTAALIAAGQMQISCNDMRFAEMDEANVPYWIESGCNTTATYVWIKTDLPSMATKTIHLYHGNGTVVSASSGSDTFDFYDNFENINIGELGSWTAEYSAGSFSRGHHAYVVTDSLTGSRAVETWMSGGGSGTYHTNHVASIAAGDYVVDFGLYTNYGHSYDSNMRSKVKINGVEKYSGLPTTGNVWENRSFDLLSSGAISSVAFGQWGSWSDADPVMRYDNVRIRRYLSGVPSIAIGASASASTYAGSFTISGIVQQTLVTLTVQNGSSVQTADIDVAGVDYMSHFKLEGSSTQTPGVAQTVTVTAMGESGNPYALYTGSRTLRFSGADALGSNYPTCNGTRFGEDTTLIFNEQGVATCNLVLYKTGSWDITATDGISTADNDKLHVAVNTIPAALHSFDVTVPTSITSESAFSLSLIAKDQYGNTLETLDANTTVSINHGTPSTTIITPASFINGTYTDTNMIVSAAYVNYNSAVLTITNGTVTATRNLNIVGVDHMDHLAMETAATERTGTGYALTLTAIGRSGNAFPGYDGQRNVIFSGADTIGAYAPVCSDIPFGTDTPLTFVGGSASCTLKIYKVGYYTVAATQDAYSASHGVNVLPNVVTGIELNAPEETTSESTFTLGITTRDAYGNVTNYVNSNVGLGVSAGAISPSALAYAQFRDDGYYTNTNFVISQIYTDQDVDITVSNNGASITEQIHVLGLNQMDHFTLSPAASSQGAGESQLLTVTAIKDSGETEMGYTGLHPITFSGAGSVGGNAPTCAGTAFGQAASLDFQNGVATCPLILYAGGAANVAISGEGYSSNVLHITVSPLTATSFDIPASFSTMSGVPFVISFVARDMYGNVTDDVPNDINVSADQGNLTPTAIAAASFIEGSYSRNFTLSGISLDATAVLTFSSGEFNTQRPVYVAGTDETSHFTLSGTGAQVAGGINTVTLTAITVSGQTDLNFTGSKSVTFSLSGTPTIDGHSPTCAGVVVGTAVDLDFQNGVATADLIIYKAGTFTLNASSNGYSTGGHSLSTSFSAGPVSTFNLSGSSSSVSDTPFPVSLIARDQYTNVTNDIPEDIAIATDAGTLSPTTIPRTDFSNGSYSGNLTLGDIAAVTAVHLTFTSGAYTGTKTVTVSPVDQMDRFTLSVSSSPTVGQAYTLTVNAIGLSGNLFPAYTDAHDITFSGADTIGDYIPTCGGTALGSPTTLTFANGRAQCPLILYKAQSVSLLAGDGTYDNQDSIPTLTILPTTVTDLIATAPASVTSAVPFTIDFVAKDIYGNTTTVVPNDINISSDHGTLTPLLVAKENLQTSGTYSQSFTLGGILTSIENNTLAFISGGISKSVTFSVNGVDRMHHFRLSGSSTQAAGTSQLLTITAIGESGGVFSGYAGIKNLLIQGSNPIGTYTPTCTDRNGNDVFLGSSAGISFQNGVATCSMKLYKTGTSEISAASSSYASTGNNLQVAVTASTLYSFSGSVPTVAVTDMPFLLTLTAKDLYGNTTKDVTNPATLSTDLGIVTPASVPASEFTSSGTYTRTVTISGISDDAKVNMIARNGDVAQPAQLTVTGIDYMDHFMVASASSRLAAGGSILATVSILKADGSVYSEFSGNKSVTFTGADAINGHVSTFIDKDSETISFGSSGILTFMSGIASTTITLYRAGAINIIATDDVHQNNVPLALTVDPGVLAAFSIDAPGEATVEIPFPITLTARDAYGNTTTEVSQDVALAPNKGTLDVFSIPAVEFAGGTVLRNLTLSGISEDGTVTLTVSSDGISSSKLLSVKASSGSSFVIPEKIDVSDTRIILLSTRRFGLLNVPANAVYIAVSDEPTFKNVSWEPIAKSDAMLNRFYLPYKLYAKFRTKSGSVSDVISCTLNISVSDGSPVGSDLVEGDIVKTVDNFDVYFIKYLGGKQYRRLILSPSVFNSYQHLRWENIKLISQKQMDEYVISDLAQVAGDTNIYELFPDGDQGTKRILDLSRSYDVDSVYEINSVDRDSYLLID